MDGLPMTILMIEIGVGAFIVLSLLGGLIWGWLFGESDDDGESSSFFEDVKHNRALDRQWKKDGCPIVYTTIGWRPDPFYKQDGFKENKPDGRSYLGDGRTYSRLVRGGTKEYREKWVEKAGR